MNPLALEPLQWAALAGCALLIGLSKTALPGAGILAVPLAAMVMPARESIGMVLPMLIFADLFAVAWYRRHAQWSHLLRLLPWTVTGLGVGFALLAMLDNQRFAPGHRRHCPGDDSCAAAYQEPNKRPTLPHHPAFAPCMGIAAGRRLCWPTPPDR